MNLKKIEVSLMVVLGICRKSFEFEREKGIKEEF